MKELKEIRLSIRKQANAFQVQLAALQADLQATKGLIQAGRNGGSGEIASPIPRSMRLDVPKFSGTDRDRWVFSINEYFTLLSTSMDQRLGVVGFNLEGVAAEWFWWMTRNKLITTWDGFLESDNPELVKLALSTTPPKPTSNSDEDANADQDNPEDQGDTLERGDISTPNSLVGNESVVEWMKLDVSITKPFKVYIGSGETLLCENICSKVGRNMQGLAVGVDLYVLPRKGPDVVLGIQWLQKLGKVTHDYVERTMEFILGGVMHTLWDPRIKIFLDNTLRTRWFRRSMECYAHGPFRVVSI
ncbi:major facilitator superfamily domain protein [Tanacetum coccineum]